jgi:hypothetical protein
MTAPVALQIQLPAETALTREEVERITGRTRALAQATWLREHAWVYELDADGTVIVGKLYANLRLAGLNPAKTEISGIADGFDMSQIR